MLLSLSTAFGYGFQQRDGCGDNPPYLVKGELLTSQTVMVRRFIAVISQIPGVIKEPAPELPFEHLNGIQDFIVAEQLHDVGNVHARESIGHFRQRIGAFVRANSPELIDEKLRGKVLKPLGYRGLDERAEANAETLESLNHDFKVLYRLV